MRIAVFNMLSQDSPPPGKYRDAIRYYEPFIQKVGSSSSNVSWPPPSRDVLQATEAHGASLLGVSAMTLANLCVAYIMISDNDKAEEVRCCARCVVHAA
jgi:hypothetical protein